jgi:hypothetical protein
MAAIDSIRQFRSKVVSTSTLPEDSLQRIAELVQRRREQSAVGAAPASPTSTAASPDSSAKAALQRDRAVVIAEESSGREVILAAQAKGMERIEQILAEDGTKVAAMKAKMIRVQALERARQAELKRLADLQRRESFLAFWNNIDRSCLDGNVGHKDRAAINEGTEALAAAYEASLMPFATDPEEFWKRGVVIPPEAEQPVLIHSPKFGKTPVSAPTYHDFAASLQERYKAHREQNGMWMPPKSEAYSPSPRRSFVQKKSPIATYVENYPFHLPPE